MHFFFSRLLKEEFFHLAEVEEFIQEVAVQLMAGAGAEVEDEVFLDMLWWITGPEPWRFPHLQRVTEKIFFLILRYFLNL